MRYPWLERPWDEFAARLEQDRLPHALLVSGPGGTGKSSLVADMMSGLLCLQTGEGGGAEACGTCRSCRLLASGAHPDRFVVEPEEGKRLITVKMVRGLIGQMMLTTTISPRKVALIAPAEAMNASAANALLKTLEEPLGQAVIILLSHDPSRLPATIRSRCQLVAVHAPEPKAAVNWLVESSELDPDSAALALEATAGSPLRAAALAGTEELERYRQLLGQLETLVGKPSQVSALAAALVGLEDRDLLWTWLSLAARKALEGALVAGAVAWPDTPYTLPPARLADLQRRADRSRKLLSTTVRQDLLIQEWLIEWARLPAREPTR
ncbi:MAG: DNA polymerase III subunit delta' [Xanthomonadales bacterium]|nr:DNA polymerase III subunit delta' [Xanthomonadales bacterium]